MSIRRPLISLPVSSARNQPIRGTYTRLPRGMTRGSTATTPCRARVPVKVAPRLQYSVAVTFRVRQSKAAIGKYLFRIYSLITSAMDSIVRSADCASCFHSASSLADWFRTIDVTLRTAEAGGKFDEGLAKVPLLPIISHPTRKTQGLFQWPQHASTYRSASRSTPSWPERGETGRVSLRPWIWRP